MTRRVVLERLIEKWENIGTARCVNTGRPTRSLDLGEEGLAMEATRKTPVTERDRAAFLAIYGRSVGGGATRRAPNKATRQRIIERQGNACLYCALPIGSQVQRRGRLVTLRLNWDHFIPYAYAVRNAADNWVIACHVCNGIKNAKMFDTVMDAQQYIRPRWTELGYERAVVFPEPMVEKVEIVTAEVETAQVLAVAVRMSERLKDSRRILPRHNLLAVKASPPIAQAALDYLIANGHVVVRVIDGRAICQLMRGFNMRRPRITTAPVTPGRSDAANSLTGGAS